MAVWHNNNFLIFSKIIFVMFWPNLTFWKKVATVANLNSYALCGETWQS